MTGETPMTTACEPFRTGLSAFVDGETTPEETRAAHAHLAHCAACRRAVDDWRLIDRLLSPEMHARPVTEQMVRGILARKRARRLAKTLLIAATLGSLIGGAMLVTLVSHSEDRGQIVPSDPAVSLSSPSGEAGAPMEMRARPASPSTHESTAPHEPRQAVAGATGFPARLVRDRSSRSTP